MVTTISVNDEDKKWIDEHVPDGMARGRWLTEAAKEHVHGGPDAEAELGLDSAAVAQISERVAEQLDVGGSELDAEDLRRQIGNEVEMAARRGVKEAINDHLNQ